MATKKMSRFNAAFKGLVSSLKSANRRRVIENVLEANELSNKSELINLEEKKGLLVERLATCRNEEVKDVIKEICKLKAEIDACKESEGLSAFVRELLDEEIEVEEK